MMQGLIIDRASPVPLYFQISQHLEKAIASGALPPGTLFENEIQLADQLGLSRPTMRRAMQHLVDQGLIVRRRGIGTRVVQPKVRRALELTSLYDDLAGSGQIPVTEVLEFEHIEADADIAERMQCAEGAPLVHIVRLRSAGENPIAKMTNYLPASVVDFDAATLDNHSLYALLRRRGTRLHSATQTVGARTATAAEAKLLREPRGAALLTMKRLTYDDHGLIVEYANSLYVASRYSFETHLVTP
jgi:GntR family transcriptional regulator